MVVAQHPIRETKKNTRKKYQKNLEIFLALKFWNTTLTEQNSGHAWACPEYAHLIG